MFLSLEFTLSVYLTSFYFFPQSESSHQDKHELSQSKVTVYNETTRCRKALLIAVI